MKKIIRKVLAVCGLFGIMVTLSDGINIYADSSKVTKFVECFEPMPVIGELNGDCWGADSVGPRDQDNGLEDRTMSQYTYWDGGIIKADDGKYYMFASRWPQSLGHEGWFQSEAVYAVSDNLYGPYEDKGILWPDYCDGAGHNVFPFELCGNDPLYNEGYRYAVCVSDTHKGYDYSNYSPANGTIHIAKDINGPWELVDNGNNGVMNTSSNIRLVNVSIAVNPNGGYVAINRYGDIATTDSLNGKWTVHVNSLWSKVPGMPESAACVEDAVTWYSNGMFHIVVNKWDARIAYYLTSENGIDDWQLHTGAAYTPDDDFLKYEDGTVNNWYKVERPNVYIEDGNVKAMIFSAIDTIKDEDKGNDQHGSKVIVVPFSSDKLEYLVTHDDPLAEREGAQPVADTSLSTDSYDKNYGDSIFMYLRRDKKYDDGVICYNSFDENADHKIGLIKYDLSECTKGEGDIIKAILSLVYLSEEDEGDPSAIWIVDDEAVKKKRDKIQVVLTETEWEEDSVTAYTRPDALYYDKNPMYAVSEEFIPTSGGLSEVKIDVTELVEEYIKKYPDEQMISFALNETADGYFLRVGTKETGSAFSPRLLIERKSAQEPEPPAMTQAPLQTQAPSQTQVPPEKASDNTALPDNVKNPQVKVNKVKITKIARRNKKLIVKYKVSGRVSGYEVVYSTDKQFKKNKKIVKTKNNSVILKKINNKKTYYVKVRGCKKDSDGVTIYGKYSGVKKVAGKK